MLDLGTIGPEEGSKIKCILDRNIANIASCDQRKISHYAVKFST